jgi:phosphate uptake regulator
MSHRKVISLGSSLAITLPSNWLKANNLEKGDSVLYNIQNDKSLLITPTHVKTLNNELFIEINEDKSLDSIIRDLVAGFLNGYTFIKLKSKKYLTGKQQKIIRKISSRFFMIIVKADSSSILLQTLIDAPNTPVIPSVERIYMLTVAMYNDVLLCLDNLDERLLESITSLENDVDQLKFLITRLIRLSIKDPSIALTQDLDSLECMDYQILVNRIERVADHRNNIALCLIALKKVDNVIPEGIQGVYVSAAEKAFSNYDKAVTSFIKDDIMLTHMIIEDENYVSDIFDKITPLSVYLGDEDKDIITYLVQIRENIKKISHYAADIAELTINQTYKKP